MMHEYGTHGWGIGWWWIVIFIVLILIVLFAVRATKRRENVNQPAGKTALDILKERYARGQIDKEEFEKRKKDLV